MNTPDLQREPSPGADRARRNSPCWAALRAQADGWIATRRTAGLQYLVVQGGDVVFEHCAGVADAVTRQPVSPDTTFNLYSLTKPLTATLVLRLALQGAIDLDAPIARAARVDALAVFGSVRETLQHRAGFANPLPLRWFHRAEDDARFDETPFVDQRLAAAAARGRIGPRYSNIGYLALGRAVEHATGLGFRRALQPHLIDLLDPGPADRLGFTPADRLSWSPGHLRHWGLPDLVLGGFVRRRDIVAATAGPWVQLRRHHVNGSAYGGLIGNARGLARFGRALLGQGGALEAPLRQWACAFDTPRGAAHTLIAFTGELAGQRWLGHAGGGLGAYGEWRLYPAIQAVSVLLTNRAGLRDVRALDAFDADWLSASAGRALPTRAGGSAPCRPLDQREDVACARPRHQLRQGDGVEFGEEGRACAVERIGQQAAGRQRAGGAGAEALDQRHVVLDRAHHLADRGVGRVLCQPQPAAAAPLRVQQPFLRQAVHDLHQVVLGDRKGLGDLADRAQGLGAITQPAPAGKHEHADGVVGVLGQFHGRRPF